MLVKQGGGGVVFTDPMAASGVGRKGLGAVLQRLHLGSLMGGGLGRSGLWMWGLWIGRGMWRCIMGGF